MRSRSSARLRARTAATPRQSTPFAATAASPCGRCRAARQPSVPRRKRTNERPSAAASATARLRLPAFSGIRHATAGIRTAARLRIWRAATTGRFAHGRRCHRGRIRRSVGRRCVDRRPVRVAQSAAAAGPRLPAWHTLCPSTDAAADRRRSPLPTVQPTSRAFAIGVAQPDDHPGRPIHPPRRYRRMDRCRPQPRARIRRPPSPARRGPARRSATPSNTTLRSSSWPARTTTRPSSVALSSMPRSSSRRPTPTTSPAEMVARQLAKVDERIIARAPDSDEYDALLGPSIGYIRGEGAVFGGLARPRRHSRGTCRRGRACLRPTGASPSP